MSAKSISHCQGKGSIAHNNREYEYKNVDTERTHLNITYIKQPISEAYAELFGEAQARYNEKQTRSDRQIDCYFKRLFGVDPNSQKAKSTLEAPSKQISFYEDLVQIGTKDDTPEEKAIHADALNEYMCGFQERNPQFHVFNAVMHKDEATPALHIDWIPVATGYKNGMDTQNGLAKALEQMGFGTGRYAIDRWRLSERKALEDICASRGIEIKPPELSRKKQGLSDNLLPDDYKAAKDQAKREAAEEAEKLLAAKAEDEAERVKIEGKIAGKKKINYAKENAKASDFGKSTKIKGMIPEDFNMILNAAIDRAAAADRARTAEAKATAADERLKDVEAREKRAEEALSQAENISEQAVQMIRQNDGLPAKYDAAIKEKSKLYNQLEEEREITATQREYIGDLKTEMREKDNMHVYEINSLKSAVEFLCNAIMEIVQAMGKLIHGESEYKLTTPTDLQIKLINSIADYASSKVRSKGFAEIAEEIDRNVFVCKAIQDIIDPPPTPILKSKSRERER